MARWAALLAFLCCLLGADTVSLKQSVVYHKKVRHSQLPRLRLHHSAPASPRHKRVQLLQKHKQSGSLKAHHTQAAKPVELIQQTLKFGFLESSELRPWGTQEQPVQHTKVQLLQRQAVDSPIAGADASRQLEQQLVSMDIPWSPPTPAPHRAAIPKKRMSLASFKAAKVAKAASLAKAAKAAKDAKDAKEAAAQAAKAKAAAAWAEIQAAEAVEAAEEAKAHAAPTPPPPSTEELQKKALKEATKGQKVSKQLLRLASENRDMLETQTLSMGMNLMMIKKLTETVKKMKAEVNKLETHEQKCQAKLGKLKQDQAQRTADSLAANMVEQS